MSAFTPANPDFEARVRDSFRRQAFMATIGAELPVVAPGQVALSLPHRPDLTQQHGFFHGGVVATIADNAAGYAAFSLMPADSSILTVEFKLNLLSPAEGDRLVAEAEVLKPGRSLTVCRSDVYGERAGSRKLIATALVTLMALPGRSDHASRPKASASRA
ncbi:MAG: PaaI family thioesterase [Alphaproteobacteria bacterium]|jgi:uncharacterized protein (TIGR00369 family)|nr:PaaI family thioesterase [Alphaproteobacteria bacterium]